MTLNTERLHRKRIGEMPLLLHMSKRLGFKQLLSHYIPTHGNEKVAATESLLLLVFNLTSGRQPLYELAQWSSQFDGRLFGRESELSQRLFNDDRYGRALDKLFAADRASLMTDLVMTMVRNLDLDMSQIHNDSTSVKSFGRMPGRTSSGLQFVHGHSKDHRPDLKQIVFSLSLSADGAVPVHCKSYAGNRNDDTTHIETWQQIRRIAGRSDFLYVADCKVCTDKQLTFIANQGGRVVTLMPDNWREATAFKEALRSHSKSKRRLLSQPIVGKRDKIETYYCFSGNHTTDKAGHTLHWIYTTEKRKRDRWFREQRLLSAEQELLELISKINSHRLKTRTQISRRIEQILKHHQVQRFYHIDIRTVQESTRVQISKGRPNRHTQYRSQVHSVYALSWSRRRQTLAQEARVDGIFPILCTDSTLGAREALLAYKYQPRLEKRFEQLKSVHGVAPTLCKKVERVEAMMFVFFMALILQAVIEREVRQAMSSEAIDAIPVYPEHRLAHHPTTAKIFDRFHDVSLYRLFHGQQLKRQYRDELTPVQQRILTLLGMSEKTYWGGTN